MELILIVAALIALAVLSGLLGYDSRDMAAGPSLLDRDGWQPSRSRYKRDTVRLPEFMGDTSGMLAYEKRSNWHWEATNARRASFLKGDIASAKMRTVRSLVLLRVGRLMVRIGFGLLALASDLGPDQRRPMITDQTSSG